MSQKNYLILDNEFISYCKLNNITDVEKFAMTVFNKGFNIVKYGETPMGFSNEKIIEKEVIKEVPLIIEKEPQVVIKEIEVVNDAEINKLKEENERMKLILDSINKKGRLMKGSNLTSLYDE